MRHQFPAKLVLRLFLLALHSRLLFAPLDNSSLGFPHAWETLAWSPSHAHPGTWNQEFCHISETPPSRSRSPAAGSAPGGDVAASETLAWIPSYACSNNLNQDFCCISETMPLRSHSSSAIATAPGQDVGSGGGRERDGEGERGTEGEERETERETGIRLDGDVLGQYIVQFIGYKAASDHKHVLQASLPSDGGWRWIDRSNPASAFPTDFALIGIKEAPREHILSALKGLSFVKDVFPQSRYTRLPLSKREKGGEAEGGESNRASLNGGKPHTRFSWDEDRARQPFPSNFTLVNDGRKLLHQHSQITSMFGADTLWKKGYTGAKVRMAVFDTGVRSDHPHFKNIKERTNWTNEDTLNDNLGHGTFVAGVIAGTDSQCLGFAPDAEIYAFRVFTDAQVSYTSWFLDAFNYAIATKMNVLNLSIGGPDYLDQPFVEKVWELTANNIIMISAIGNDGPLYGTLNNPADQSDVIGVGGIDYNDHIASFSSRGMSTWEIPHGYGRVKPDIVAYGRDIFGSKISTGCKSLSGTSVASPVVAGAVCLLASVIPENIRWDVLNPASMKQALVQGAARLNGPNMFEQGAGRLDLLESYEILSNYKPRASVIPPYLDFTDCPYFWPFCRQPLYAGAMPVIFNATILNGMGVVGYIEGTPMWHPLNKEGDLLDIRFTFSDVIWPWTGFLGLYMQIKNEGSKFSGVVEGNITFTVVSPPGKGEVSDRRSACRVAVKINVIPTPPRDRRLLWDQFHSVRYPPGYIPRDSLDVRTDILDWHGDHLHTNFHSMFDMLRDAEYFIETLGSPLICFEASQYGTLLMVDLEDEFFPEEIKKLEDDVKNKGLGLIVFADWYNVETMVKMKFFDDNTRSWWTPLTGGANVPALNDLLQPFGIAFGDTILNGPYFISGERGFYASGTDITRLPAGGFLHRFKFQDSIGGSSGSSLLQTSSHAQVEAAILGAIKAGDGRVAVFGDSNCLDSSHMVINCYWLLKKLLEFTSQNKMDPNIFSPDQKISSTFDLQNGRFPIRREDVNFSLYSSVKKHAMECKNDARFDAQELVFRTTLKRQPMGIPSNTSISVPVAGTNDSLQKPRSTSTIDQKVSTGDQGHKVLTGTTKQTAVRSATERWHQGRLDMGFHGIGWSTPDEVDFPLTAVQGVIPLMLCVIGFVMILGLCRMQQKRPRRARKGQMRSSSL